MHELSIAQGILDIALREKHHAGAVSLMEIELEIGKLTGIEYHSFDFALETVLKISGLSSVNIIIHKPEGKAVCLDCGSEFEIYSLATQCPSCQSFRCQINQGKELRLKSIIIDK